MTGQSEPSRDRMTLMDFISVVRSLIEIYILVRQRKKKEKGWGHGSSGKMSVRH
jgi:hypothetical protein